MISVSVVTPKEALSAPWDDLRPFAHNAFLNPMALKAASDTLLTTIYILLAWDLGSEPAKLIGLWAVQAKSFLLLPFLETLPFDYAVLSTPVLHPDHAEEVMPAFLAAIAGDRRLPNAIYLRELDAAGREYEAFEHATAQHPQCVVRTDQRPIAGRAAGIKRSGSTRKKLRQDWNRLAALGNLQMANDRAPDAVRAALEVFLTMEARSWKGAGHTALLSDPRDAAFARRVIGDFADRGEASVALLTLGGKPIATQVLVYCGRTAYTWKTSYDPDYAAFSPGSLLVDRITTDLVDSGAVELVDSCARGDGFMGQLFSARKPMRDLVVSATPRGSLGYHIIAGYFWLRETAKTIRDSLSRKRSPSRPKPLPAPANRPAAAASPVARAAPSQGSTTDRAA